MATDTSSLLKLTKIQLPTGTQYAFVDKDGRLMIAPEFSSSVAYSKGDYVMHSDLLYRALVDNGPAAWDATKWTNITVGSELKRLEGIMAGGVHYRGKTTTALYDGATTNPITISGSSYTAESGDLVLLDLASASVSVTYATNTQYAIHTYIKNDALYYITNAAISSEENTSFTAIEGKLDQITSEPEFLFDGTNWALLGSISEGLGELAFKDSASGTYTKPTGSGSVTIKTYSQTQKKLVRTTITGTNGTVNASEVTGGTSKTQWKQDVTNPAVVYGTADVGDPVVFGTADTDTPVTSVAQVDTTNGEQTFANPWSSSNTSGAVTASVSDQMLVLGEPSKHAIIGVADTTGVSITPAKAASSSQTMTPAKAADSTRTINNLVSDGTLTGSYTITARTPAAVASSATYVATGAVDDNGDGGTVTTNITQSTESAPVTVGTTTDTVTVK